MSVDVIQDGRVTVVTINRPEVRNAVDRPAAERLAEIFTAFDKNPDTDVAVLTGADGVFCAGADLKAVSAGTGNRLKEDGDGPLGCTRMLLSKPVIAAVEGFAVAGGLELALWCDLRVAAEDAVFGVYCRRWGVPLVDGGTIRLSRLIGHSHALDLILTGRGVSGDEARGMGLANRVVAQGAALEGACELARSLTEFPQLCMRNDRLSSYQQWPMELPEALAQETRLGLEVIRSGETREGATRFAQGKGRHGTFDNMTSGRITTSTCGMKRDIDDQLDRHVRRPIILWSDCLTLDERLRRCLTSLSAPDTGELEVLKKSPRRCVARVRLKLPQGQGSIESLIIKGFPLQKPESRIKFRRYGLAEANNYLALRERAVRVPRFYGYFEQRSLGTVKANGVLIEDLHDHMTLHDAALNAQDAKLTLLKQAIPVIDGLFQQGVNHIDTTAHNLLLSPAGELVLIDWQYASFVQARDYTQLILQAAQFLRYSDLAPDSVEWTEWLECLFETCDPDLTWESFRSNVAALQGAERPSSVQRMALTVPLPYPLDNRV